MKTKANKFNVIGLDNLDSSRGKTHILGPLRLNEALREY